MSQSADVWEALHDAFQFLRRSTGISYYEGESVNRSQMEVKQL
jgi:hypothetical protein